MGKSRKKSKLKPEKVRPLKDITTGAITAIIGTAFVAQTADVLKRI